MRGRAEFLVRHHAREDLFIALHPVDEEFVEHALQVGGEVRQIVGLGGLDYLVALFRAGTNLVEEKLVRLREVSDESLV